MGTALGYCYHFATNLKDYDLVAQAALTDTVKGQGELNMMSTHRAKRLKAKSA